MQELMLGKEETQDETKPHREHRQSTFPSSHLSYSTSSDPSSRSPSPQIPLEVLSSILPQLPCEILTNILKQIQNDKVSLAKCMRVSNIFNAIARPILYSTLTMEAGKIDPYDTTKGGYQFVPHRISPDMFKNVVSIKHIIVKHHHHPSEMKILTTKVFDVNSLRVPTWSLDRTQPCGRCSDELGLGIKSCLLIRKYRPKKLIVDGASVGCGHHHVADFAQLETLVYRIAINPSHRSTGWWPRSPLPRSSAGVRRIIQVFSDSGLYGAEPQTPLQAWSHQGRAPSNKYLAQFASGVGWLINHHSQVKDFLVVNGRQIHYNALDLPYSTSLSEREAKFEAMIYDTLCENVSFKVQHHPGLISIRYKKRNIEIKFISLRKYLETYDWSREFTDEEAEPWLNDDWTEIE